MRVTFTKHDDESTVLMIFLGKSEGEKLAKLLDSGKRTNDYDKELVAMAERIVRMLR